MPFSPLRQLASARSSRHPVSDTPSAIRIHAPRRYPCEPNGITHTPSQLYAAKSLRIWLAPSPDVPAVFEATYNTVVLEELCAARGINGNVMSEVESNSNFGKYIRAISAQPGFESVCKTILIVSDNDDSPADS